MSRGGEVVSGRLMSEAEILDMWFHDNAKGRRDQERRCRKAAEPMKGDTVYRRNILALADAHAKAAEAYEEALCMARIAEGKAGRAALAPEREAAGAEQPKGWRGR